MNLRRSLTVAAVGLPVLSSAQWADPSAATRLMRARGLFPVATPNPLNPPPRAPGPQALPDTGNPQGGLEIVRVPEVDRQGDDIVLSGEVEFLYRGYRIFADKAEGNLRTERFRLIGNVKVIGEDSTVAGDEIELDMKARTYVSRNAQSTLTPRLVGGGLLRDVYIDAAESRGSRRNVKADNCDITTCDLDHPHYHLESRQGEVRPGKRVILRNASLYILDFKVFTIPYLSIPLDDRRNQYFPEVGQSPEEGYYIKTRWGVPVPSETQNLIARVDYMTRLGPGLGGEFRYQNKGSEGSVSAYTIPLGAQSLVTNIDHRQSVGSGRLGVQLDLQWNSIYSAPDATVYNLRSQYDLSDLRGSTSVSYTRSGSEFPESRVASESIGLRLDRTLSRTERLSADTSLNTSESPSDLYRDAEVRFRYTRQFPNFEGRVDYQRTIPIGETEFAGGTGDRVPVLTLSSDSSRLFGRKFGTEWPVRTEISVGEFGRTAGDNVQRAAFSVSLNKPDRRNQRFRFDYNAQFRQGIYSDDTAQYVVGGGFTSSYRLGTRSSLNLRYNYSRPEGYTPLSLDRAGQVHLASLDAGVEPLNYTYFGLQTGYDFFRVRQSQTGWQQLAVRAEVNRGREFSLRSLASYDTFSSRWQSVRLDLSLAKNYLLTVGARYDGLSSRWSNVNVYLNGLRWAKARFDVTASYNGFTTQLDAIQVATVYDLHCAEAVFLYSNFRTGFRSGQEFSFFIRLKALPSDYAFGVGRRGQPLGTSTGIDY